MVKSFRKLRSHVRRFLNWLLSHEGTPGQRARGLAAGVFSGCFPLFGLQTMLGIALAGLIRGNLLLAAVATWISNPITYLPLYWFNYQVGNALLEKSDSLQFVDQATFEFYLNQGWLFVSRLLLGSTIVGISSSFFIGLSTYFILRKKTNSAVGNHNV